MYWQQTAPDENLTLKSSVQTEGPDEWRASSDSIGYKILEELDKYSILNYAKYVQNRTYLA